MSNLQLRVISGVIMAIAVLAATWFGGVAFRLLWVAAAGVALHEWLKVSGAPGRALAGAIVWAAYCAVALMLLFPGIAATAGLSAESGALAALAAGVLLLLVLEQAGGQRPWAAAGLAYALLPAIAFGSLRDGPSGFAAILFLFAAVWATDIFAYFTGRAIGGPKLAPSISPGKTWSGAVGGTVFAVLAVAALACVLPTLALPAILVPAIALSVVSQIGDLAESAFKRRFGVKDSGNFIPGHGGVMDRIDGLAVAAVALYLIASLSGAVPGLIQ